MCFSSQRTARRADLSRLETGQALHIIWLLQQIGAAMEGEQGLDGQENASLIGADMRPTEQIAVLRDRLCALAGVDTFRGYAQSGKVRVPWSTVLKVGGLSRLDDRERKRCWPWWTSILMFRTRWLVWENPSLIALFKTFRNFLRRRRWRSLQEAGDAGNSLKALNTSLADRLPKGASGDPQDGDDGAMDDAEDGEEGDERGYDLHHEAAPAQRPPAAYTPNEPTGEVPPPKRGTPPPDRSNGWEADPYALLMSGLEGIRQGIDLSAFAHLSDLQKREVRLMWRETVETLVYAGMELPDPASEQGDVRWPPFPDA